jgi:hypothetical protein
MWGALSDERTGVLFTIAAETLNMAARRILLLSLLQWPQ